MAWHDGPAGVGEQGRCGAGGPGTWESSLSPWQESRRDAGKPIVRAGAENTRGSTGANQRVLSRYRQAKATKRGEKGNEQS